METRLRQRLEQMLAGDERPSVERRRLAWLMARFARLAPPPDPCGLVPRWDALQAELVAATAGDDGERLEEAFLALYAHLHGHEAPYTAAERRRMDAAGGYWNHAGGLSPVLKAPDHLFPAARSADLGAGNGLQGLLMQLLAPHARTVQVEISSRAVAFGRALQRWLGIAVDRVDWRAADVRDVDAGGFDLLYLYRPLRPTGPGDAFYRRLASQLAARSRPAVVFSIADCLRDYLGPDFEVFYGDGQLTCMRGPLAAAEPQLREG